MVWTDGGNQKVPKGGWNTCNHSYSFFGVQGPRIFPTFDPWAHGVIQRHCQKGICPQHTCKSPQKWEFLAPRLSYKEAPQGTPRKDKYVLPENTKEYLSWRDGRLHSDESKNNFNYIVRKVRREFFCTPNTCIGSESKCVFSPKTGRGWWQSSWERPPPS